MRIVQRRIGSVGFEIHTDSLLDIFPIIETVLGEECIMKNPQSIVTINYDSKPDLSANNDQGPDRVAFQLKHVTYVYEARSSTYYVHADDFARGFIDSQNSTATWNVLHTSFPPRSAAHILILDPLSLLLLIFVE